MRRVVLALVLLALLPTPTQAAEPYVGRVTQRYSARHRGVDIAAPRGTIIRSIGYGTVVYAGWRNNCGGWQVYVKTSNLYVTYNHLSRILTAKGHDLIPGHRIGKVGSTGCSTGPHTHIEMWLGYPWRAGSYRVDPSPFIWRPDGPDRRRTR